uniref:Autophagy-related protein 16 domain-containing protein n=2 Tax=Craspedostauros australis TaxID=1486917 RepID=A0A7R9ZJY0_9STRA|mmetsp:Transcript_14613/g.40308  ORF Transcript_14613/g.40308 Transcript_14613/m.40308 type:complete len:300 (+) Transcript_14613:113-1012(+)
MTSIYDQLHQQILDRNARETDPFWSIHASNHDLVAEVEELQSKYEELKRIGMMHPSGKGSADGAAPEQDMANRESAALQNEVRLREQLEKLQEELSSTEQMRDEEKTKVAETTKGLEEARMLNAKKDKEISILEEERDTLQRGMDHLTGKVTDAEARMSLAEQQCVGLKDSIRLMQEENATVAKSKDDLEARFLTEKTKLSQSIAELMDTVDALKKEVSTLHTFRQKHDERTRWLDDARIIQIKKAKDENDDGGTASSTASSTAAAASVAPSAAAKTVQAHTKEATSARSVGFFSSIWS